LTQAILGVRARGGIAIVIAHRPSALAGVDLVLMMAEGKAQAFGPKDEVLNKVLRRPQPPAAGGPSQGRRRRSMTEAPAMNDPKPMTSRRSIRLHLLAGVTVVALLAGAVGGWAGTTEISGAVVAPGVFVVESNVKKVQHPTGGIVGELRVQDGSRVKVARWSCASTRP
jgi:hypothetical protein